MLKFKDWLRRRSDHFELRLTDSCTIFKIYRVQVLVRPKLAEMVRGFLIKVNSSPIRLKLTDSVLDD